MMIRTKPGRGGIWQEGRRVRVELHLNTEDGADGFGSHLEAWGNVAVTGYHMRCLMTVAFIAATELSKRIGKQYNGLSGG
jgi:hypothetical protein